MKQFFKNFFTSIHGPIILTCLCLILVIGAAAAMVPAANQAVDKSDCRHPYVRLINQGETDAGTDYVFRCPTCLATIHETPERSHFSLHRPTIIDGAVIMTAPWEIGAYYGDEYRLANKKAAYDGWFTDGELWASSTGVRVTESNIGMVSSRLGDAAISFVAEEAGYIRPAFSYVACWDGNKSCAFEIRLNGEKVSSTLYLSSTSTDAVNLTDEWNAAFADLWIPVSVGDKLSYVILYDGVVSTDLAVSPVVEFMQYNPNRK